MRDWKEWLDHPILRDRITEFIIGDLYLVPSTFQIAAGGKVSDRLSGGKIQVVEHAAKVAHHLVATLGKMLVCLVANSDKVQPASLLMACIVGGDRLLDSLDYIRVESAGKPPISGDHDEKDSFDVRPLKEEWVGGRIKAPLCLK